MKLNKHILLSAFGILLSLLCVRCTDSNPETNVEEIIVVCKTHFDIGYTHRVDELVKYYQTIMIDNALAAMKESEDLPEEEQFVWTAPAWVMSKVLEDWDGQTPERKKQLEDAFRSGRFVSHALPFTSHTDIMSAEEFARGLQFSSDISQDYGLPLPRDGKMTDVPSHTRTLATGLANSGVKFMHIGCNWPSGNVDYPGLFWWEGPDGSRVLTMYSSIYSTCTALWPKTWGGNRGEDHPGVVGTNLLPPKDWPHKVWLAIIVTPDNTGPPAGDALQALFDEVTTKMPGVKIRMGMMQDFAEAIIESGAELPVVRKEAPDTWIHGVMSDPGGMKTYRNLQTLSPSAEILNTQLQFLGVNVSEAKEILDEANEKIMLYAEHTWGGAANVYEYGDDFYKQAADKYQMLEESWEDKTNYVTVADKLIRKQIQSDLTALASQVGLDGKRMIIYNPLPWERSGFVQVPESPGKYYYAENIPASGYKTVPYDEAGRSVYESEAAELIENEYYKITFDLTKGVIKSFINKRTGREYVDHNTSYGLGQYMNERFTYEQCLGYTLTYQNGRALGAVNKPAGEDWPHPGISKPGMVSELVVPYRKASPGNASLKIERDELMQTAVLSMAADYANHMPAFELHVKLGNGMPYVDMECIIQDKRKDNWPESDWLCLPFNIKNPTFNIGRALGVMNPEEDILPGANRHLFAVGSGLTITGSDGAGVSICPIDHPLVSLGQPGIWKSSRDYVPQEAVVFLNLYNNMWNTNFRYWYPGTWSSRVRIWTFEEQKDAEKRFQILTMEARNPLMTSIVEGKGANQALQKEGITLSRKGTTITAFSKQDQSSDGTLLRVWEKAGKSGEIKISFPPEMEFTSAQAVNLRGEITGEKIPVNNGILSFKLGKYAPASFILN